jgi:DNA-binding GntR family transcriptional regulator
MASTSHLAAPVPRLSLGDVVYDRLSRAILAGEFACGHEFNEVELAQQLDVSRTPVREALRRLERDGLVTTERHRHPAVVNPSREDLIEAFQVRQFLEAGAASVAAERITDEQLKELRVLAAASELDQPDWCDAERRFDARLHAIIAEAAGNKRLEDEIDRCVKLFRLVRHQVAQLPERQAVGHVEHLVILRALEARDPAAAAAAMTEHIQAALQAILHYLK